MAYSIRITVLIDNTSLQSDVSTEHGLAMWIEYNGKKILFDAGQSNALIKNAEKFGIDLAQTDAIVLSHGHYDHTGGLADVMALADGAKVYIHPGGLDAKYSSKNGNCRYIGIGSENKQQLKKDKVIYTENETEICEGATVTGEVPRTNEYEDTGGNFYRDEQCRLVDEMEDDQSLFLESPKGVVVVCGCAHSGIVNILNYISKLTKKIKIYAVIGGLHLVNASSERIEKTFVAFNKYDVRKIMPLHCTGNEAMVKMKTMFSERCLPGGVGAKLCI